MVPIEDAFVVSSSVDTNYGSIDPLTVAFFKIAYMQFYCPATMTGGTLRLYCSDYAGNVNIYSSTQTWQETIITYNTKLSVFLPVTVNPVLNKDNWTDVNVSSILTSNWNEIQSAGKTVTFVIERNTVDANIGSREGIHQASLVLSIDTSTITTNIRMKNTVLPEFHCAFLELYGPNTGSPSYSSLPGYCRLYSIDDHDLVSPLNPVPISPTTIEGLWNGPSFYSCWKQVATSLNVIYGNINQIIIWADSCLDSTLVMGSIPGDSKLPPSSYCPAMGCGYSGYPIYSTVLNSRHPSYSGTWDMSQYLTESQAITFDTSINTGNTLNGFLCFQIKTGSFLGATRYTYGIGLDYGQTYLGEWDPTVIHFRFRNTLALQGNWYHYKDLTIKWSAINTTIPMYEILYSPIMSCITGTLQALTLTAYDNSSSSSSTNDLFVGSPYFGAYSILRGCVTAIDGQSLGSTIGSFPSGWSTDTSSNTTFQLKGSISYLTINAGNYSRFGFRLMVPYDFPRPEMFTLHPFFLSYNILGGKNTLLWNIGTTISPIWVKSNTILFTGKNNFIREYFEEYPLLDRIYVPLGSYTTEINRLVIIYDRYGGYYQ